MFSLICVWINGWVNTREGGDLRRYRGQYDVIIVNDDVLSVGTLGINKWWNFDRNRKISIPKNAFENTICKMAAILFRSQCVKINRMALVCMYKSIDYRATQLAPDLQTPLIIILGLPVSKPFLKMNMSMMTSSNGNIFRVTGHLCGEFTGPRWIPHTKASDAELWCLLWSAPE